MASTLEKEHPKQQYKIRKIKEGKQMFPIEIRHHEKNINMIAFNRAGTVFATCSADARVNVYNSINYKMINQFKLPSAIRNIVFTGGDRIIASSLYAHVYILNPFSADDPPKLVHVVVEDNKILTTDLSANGRLLGFLFERRIDGRRETVVQSFLCSALEELPTDTDPEKEGRAIDKLVVHEIADLNLSNFKFFLLEQIVFTVSEAVLKKFDTSKSVDSPVAQLRLGDDSNIVVVKNITVSPRYEFLLLSYNEGVKMVDPEAMTLFRTIETKHPVNCAQLSPLMYSTPPKFHLIFGGGIEAVQQAQKTEGGNQIFIFNPATEEKIGEIRSAYGNINWLVLFKDGSGILTAGEEGICRIYRFDESYYQEDDNPN